MAPRTMEQAMCPLESQRHPIPSGRFRISFGPEQEVGEKQKLGAEFSAQYLAQTRAPPPARPAAVYCPGTTRTWDNSKGRAVPESRLGS